MSKAELVFPLGLTSGTLLSGRERWEAAASDCWEPPPPPRAVPCPLLRSGTGTPFRWWEGMPPHCTQLFALSSPCDRVLPRVGPRSLALSHQHAQMLEPRKMLG